ncbi:MAG: hypothetical protein JW741_15105 [Sedimentisphaerales bacterium]|nr:hypothetical protein [Sedimentisphaerales bacterium]
MWRTSCGDRTLQRAEARLFAEVLLSLLDQEEALRLEDCPLGIECYDRLTYGQRICVLGMIGNGLLRADVPTAPLTPVVDAAVAAVFEHLKSLVEMGIDEPAWWKDWRTPIVAAGREMGAEGMPDPSCDDIEEWERAIQELKDGILSGAGRQGPWRRAGRPPETSTWTEQEMRTPRDLLGAGVEELNAEQIEAKIAELREVCRVAIETG